MNTKTIKVKFLSEIPKDFTGIAEYYDGTKQWYLNGKLHRENDLLAMEYADGRKEWWLNGKLHRENDLPAIEWADGSKSWFLKGLRHRENDLPAVVYANETKEWWLNGFRHRENDLPAIEQSNGYKAWYLNGLRHRENDLPAIKYPDGSKEWFLNGERHRENDLPACEYIDGTKEWWLNGKLHRENDFPAVEYPSGTKQWLLNGKLHRENGPACEHADGTKEWWLNNKKYSEEEWKKEVEKLKMNTKTIKVKFKSEIPNDFTGIAEYPDGTKWWVLNGELHRETGPAIEWANGSKEWWLNGKNYSEEDWKKEVEKLKMNTKTIKVKNYNEIPKDFTGMAEHADGSKQWFLNRKLHRENDLPAIEHPNGTKMWYLNGKPHRDNDLPAIEYPSGTKQWWLNGELHRENDLPAVEHANGEKYWYLNGELHRDNDLPTIEYADGRKFWFLNGKRHRETGPAVECPNGTKEWFLNGKQYSEKDWKKEIEKLIKNKSVKVKNCSELPENDPKIEFSDEIKNDKPYNFSEKSNSVITQQLTIQEINKKGIRMMENLDVVNDNNFTNTLKEDGKLILKRAAGRKIVNIAANLLTGFLTMGKTKKQSKSIQNAITETLQTENGKAMLGFLLGAFLPMFLEQIPKKYHEITKEMAQEFRVESGAHFATVAMDFLTGPMFTGAKNTFIEALDTILPQTEDNLDSKVRVSINNNNSKAEIEEVNQKEEKQNVHK